MFSIHLSIAAFSFPFPLEKFRMITIGVSRVSLPRAIFVAPFAALLFECFSIETRRPICYRCTAQFLNHALIFRPIFSPPTISHRVDLVCLFVWGERKAKKCYGFLFNATSLSSKSIRRGEIESISIFHSLSFGGGLFLFSRCVHFAYCSELLLAPIVIVIGFGMKLFRLCVQ